MALLNHNWGIADIKPAWKVEPKARRIPAKAFKASMGYVKSVFENMDVMRAYR